MTGSAGHTTGAIRSVVLVCVLLLWTESTQVRRMVGVDSAPAVPLRLRGGMPPRRAAQRRSAAGSAVSQAPLSEQPQAADRVRGVQLFDDVGKAPFHGQCLGIILDGA